jgi:hypothetical protein
MDRRFPLRTLPSLPPLFPAMAMAGPIDRHHRRCQKPTISAGALVTAKRRRFRSALPMLNRSSGWPRPPSTRPLPMMRASVGTIQASPQAIPFPCAASRSATPTATSSTDCRSLLVSGPSDRASSGYPDPERRRGLRLWLCRAGRGRQSGQQAADADVQALFDLSYRSSILREHLDIGGPLDAEGRYAFRLNAVNERAALWRL